MSKRVKFWPFDLASPGNQSFQGIVIWVILKASIASKTTLKIKKNLMKHFWDIFKKVSFYAQNKLKRRPRARVEFFQKFGSVTPEYLWWLNIMQYIKKNRKNGSWEIGEIGVTDGRTDGRTNRQDWNYRTLPLKRRSKCGSFWRP